MITQSLIINLIIILASAWLFGGVFARFGLPVILGELLAGLILGPPLLGIITVSEPINFLAELGIFFMVFLTGLEMDPKELVRHIKPALAVAIGGFVVPFALGVAASMALGATTMQALFIGMGLSVTSLAVQARLLRDLHIQQTKVGHIIIGAAIADDVLALVTLSILLGIAQNGAVLTTQILSVIFKVVGFFIAAGLISHYILPRLTGWIYERKARAFTFTLMWALLLAYMADLAGLHIIIGAFVAGMVVRKEITDEALYERLSDRFYGLSYGFLAPIFFVSLSFHLKLTWDWSFLILAVGITLIATIGKLVGCAVGAIISGHNKWEASIIGFSMNGRGAVELVVAMIVLHLSHDITAVGGEPLLTEAQFSALVLMAFITTFIAPILLKWGVRSACSHDEHMEFCSLELRKKGKWW